MANISVFSQTFFQKEKLIETGVYYYPEAWDSTQWDRDFKNMAKMGFEFTHFAEFAWAMLEPEEGKYDFEWLDKAVFLANKNGLKVIMCTPSATPPVWLTQKYPETLVVKDNSVTASHGTREQCSWSSLKYRDLCAKIVERMAKHYGNNDGIMGWQIDNEPSHYGTIDYGNSVALRFREWLQDRYKTIGELNKVWGTTFWSGIYTNFNQIVLPNPSQLISGMASPHAMLDFKRFNADECASFLTLQHDILRKSISSKQFITSNFMNFHTDVDPWRSSNLDFICYTMYPVAGDYSAPGVGDQGFRLGNPNQISFANDFFRPFKGITGVMELQPGQVNWGNYNPQPYPGAIRAWLWNAFAGGLSFACTYRYRQPLSGSEQYHYGIVNTDGVTPSPGGLEYAQFMKEIKELRKMYNPKAEMPSDYAKSKTALLFNMDNVWNQDIQKQSYQWSFSSHMMKYYSILKSFCIPVDFISPDRDFSSYKTLVAPAYQLMDEKLAAKLIAYVQNGGNLILTCRSGQKDANGHFREQKWAAVISDLIGGDITMYDVLPESVKATVSANDKSYEWNNWADIIVPQAGTNIWATYSDQFYVGKASVINRKLGNGTVTYIGVDTDNGELEKEIVRRVYVQASIKIKELPLGVSMHWNDGFWIAINYNSKMVSLDIPLNSKIIFGSKDLNPAQVLVWTEE